MSHLISLMWLEDVILSSSSGTVAYGTGSAQGHPITFSGGSVMDSGATGGYGESVGAHPVMFSGGRVMDSGGMRSAPGSVRGHPLQVFPLSISTTFLPALSCIKCR